MAYKVTLTFVVGADSEETLERYVDALAYEIAESEGFLLDNREIREIDVPLTGSYRTVHRHDLTAAGPRRARP
jgi:hypothetical protein